MLSKNGCAPRWTTAALMFGAAKTRAFASASVSALEAHEVANKKATGIIASPSMMNGGSVFFLLESGQLQNHQKSSI
jgi:hypothetical protein